MRPYHLKYAPGLDLGSLRELVVPGGHHHQPVSGEMPRIQVTWQLGRGQAGYEPDIGQTILDGTADLLVGLLLQAHADQRTISLE